MREKRNPYARIFLRILAYFSPILWFFPVFLHISPIFSHILRSEQFQLHCNILHDLGIFKVRDFCFFLSLSQNFLEGYTSQEVTDCWWVGMQQYVFHVFVAQSSKNSLATVKQTVHLLWIDAVKIMMLGLRSSIINLSTD